MGALCIGTDYAKVADVKERAEAEERSSIEGLEEIGGQDCWS